MASRPRRGRLVVVHGSMFGGKTEYLIAELRRARARGLRVRAFKHAIDNRYDPTHLITHTQDKFDAVPVPDAASILAQASDVDFVALDEGQFFKHALIDVVEQLLSRGTDVVVAGISNDAWGRPFEPIPQLTRMADEIVVRQSPCRVCGRPSPYTQRMTPVNSLHMVGGLGEYEPRCAEHFTPLPIPPETR